MSTAGTGFCSVAVRTAGCVFVVDGACRGGWSLFLISSVAMMLLWILYSIANRVVFQMFTGCLVVWYNNT